MWVNKHKCIIKMRYIMIFLRNVINFQKLANVWHFVDRFEIEKETNVQKLWKCKFIIKIMVFIIKYHYLIMENCAQLLLTVYNSAYAI